MKLSELYERCNETELYQIARAAGLYVQPATTKSVLIEYILGEAIPPPEPHELDEWRVAIMGFVIEHRKRLEVQLRCPAKSMDPRACFQCVDHQVSSCLVENKQNLHLIRIHKKPIEQPTGDVMAETDTLLDPQNAPRDKAKLKATGTFQLRKLAEALGMLPGDPEKMAFGKLSIDDRVEEIMKRLAEFDTKAGGAPPARTPVASAPTATSETPGTSVPAVDPAAFRAAQDATGPSVATAGRRQPKEAGTNGVAPASGDIAAVLMALQAMSSTSGALAAAQVSLVGEVKGLSEGIEAKLTSLEKAIIKAASEQMKILKCSLSAILTIAEERGVASRFEILTDALGEADRLDAMIAEIKGGAKSSGKAA